jgi:pimeloyl-ACP methyl ester carboxylesterase
MMRALLAAVLLSAACTAPRARPAPEDAAVAATKTSTACDLHSLAREETRLPSEPGIEVFVMRVAAPKERRGAVLLTHGAGSQGSALWDLKTKDYSFMRKLACKGFDAYSVDVRGFGGSTIPDPPVDRLREVMADVEAAVGFARERSRVPRVDLVGWSWGSEVAAMYAGLHPERVRRLVMFAPVYDRRWPERHKTENGWYPVKRETFFQYHDPAKEDRAVLEEFVQELFRFAKGEELMLPNGPYLDLYGEEAPIWEAAKIEAPTLVVRGDLDRASLDAHAQKLFAALANAKARRYVVIGGADHFAFRTYKYRELQSVIFGFLEE